MLEVAAPIFVVAIGRTGFLGTLLSGFVGAVKGDGRGILMNSGCCNLVGLQRPQGKGAEDLVEIGLKERIEGLSQTGVVERERL